MSGVFQRNRDMSQVEWVWTAREIRHEIDSLARSEKVVPKSARFTHGVRLCDHAANLVYAVRKAYLRYPNTPLSVIERKQFLQEALDECWILVEDLQNIKDEGFPINLNRYDRVAELLETEIDLLGRRKKNTRLTGKASLEERIEAKQLEIEGLERLLQVQKSEQTGYHL